MNGSDAHRLTEAKLADANAVDPYLMWAEQTGFAAYRQTGGNGRIRVAIELHSTAEGPAFLAAASSWLTLSTQYRQALAAARCRHFTALVRASQIGRLEALVRRVKPGLIAGRDVDRDLGDASVGSLEDLNSAVLRPALVLALKRSVVHGGALRIDNPAVLRSLRRPAAGAPRQPVANSTPLMGVIDFGCAFAHRSFQRFDGDGNWIGTRVLHMWDQGRSNRAGSRRNAANVWPWKAEPAMGYGREATAERLNALIRSAQSLDRSLPPARVEELCYVAAELPELLDPWSHGTSVLGFAAGWPHPHMSKGDAPDAAAGTDIVFVQLPQQAVDDLSGGWVTPYVLDGLSYIVAKAQGQPVVINISIGSLAGPHDGSSLLEVALDECATLPGVTVVMAAGNTAGKLGHARAADIAPGATATLQWVVPKGDPTQSFLEFWYARPVDGSVPVFALSHPDIVPLGVAARLFAPIDRLHGIAGCHCGALLQIPDTTAGSDAGMALVALAPTDSAASGEATDSAPAGAWTIQVTNTSAYPLDVHAWIERDEPGSGPQVDRPDSVLVAQPGAGFVVTDACTLTAQSTGTHTVVVGAYVLNEQTQQTRTAHPPDPAASSALGPSRTGLRLGVDALAPGDLCDSKFARGLPVLSNRSEPSASADGAGACIRLEGTSLAAPWAARQLLNAIAEYPALRNRTDLLKHMRQEAVRRRDAVPQIHWVEEVRVGASTSASAVAPPVPTARSRQ